MDKEQLKKELAEYKEILAGIAGSKKMFDRKIAEIEAELAEEPKLRHGDYGYRQGCTEPIIIMDSVNREERLCFRTKAGGMGEYTSVRHGNCTLLGNIFDDLKAMEEDLTEFKMDNGTYASIEVQWHTNGQMLRLRDKDGFMLIKYRDVPAFILNLRRMEATLKKQKK